MTNEYINHVKKRREKQEYKELCLFGYGFGTFITLLFFLKYLLNNENLSDDKFYELGMALGGIILGFTIINPYALKCLKKLVNRIIRIIFYVLFGILLTIVYYVCITPTGFFVRRKNKDNTNKTTNFVEKRDFESEPVTISHNKFYQLFQIMHVFFRKEYVILLPSIIIIIILGLSFVFLQSNVVAPFIYTIF